MTVSLPCMGHGKAPAFVWQALYRFKAGQTYEERGSMAFDFKKEYKELYLPKQKPQIVQVPPMNYVAVRGRGDPNAENGDYQQCIKILYTLSYTLKKSPKAGRKIEGFFPYAVPPLEGFWWQDGDGMDYGNKESLNWISCIRLPDFISPGDFAWAVARAAEKKKTDCSAAEFLTIEEGLCVQMMHLGPFDAEPTTVAVMDGYLAELGLLKDVGPERRHHEIYLSDPRRVAPEKWKTVIRQPIKNVQERPFR